MRTLSITTLLTLTFTVGVKFSNAQVNDQNLIKEVLQKAIVDSTFIFGKWTKDAGTETHLKYLGTVRTVHGQTFKIINSIYFWGLSHRATSRILFFNSQDKYVSNYTLALTSDLPTKLLDGKLIFKNNNRDCDHNLTTIVDLKKGLPKQFFRKCKGESGDLYVLEKE